MCEPTTIIAGTALVLSAAGVGVSAYGQYQQKKADNAAAEYNAKVLENNAKVAGYQAADAKARGDVAEKQYRLQVSKLIGEQRAGYAGSGVVVDTGSALDVRLDTAEQGELDALTIRHNAALEAWGYKNQANSYTSQAVLSRAGKSSPGFAATSTLLTGAGQVAGQAASYGYLKQGGAPAKAGV